MSIFSPSQPTAILATGIGEAVTAAVACQSEWVAFVLRQSALNVDLVLDLVESTGHGDHVEVLSDYVQSALEDLPNEAARLSTAGAEVALRLAAAFRGVASINTENCAASRIA